MTTRLRFNPSNSDSRCEQSEKNAEAVRLLHGKGQRPHVQCRNGEHDVQTTPWDSHGRKSLEPSHSKQNKLKCHSDLSLEGSDRESLDDSPGWPRLDLHLLTEHNPHSCLGGWLDASLDPAKSWDGKDACLLDLRGNFPTSTPTPSPTPSNSKNSNSI